jgi:flavodoxin I
MTRIGLFYGSSAGNTEDAAQMIKKEFDALHPGVVSMVNVASYGDLKAMETYDKIIMGASSWLDGGLQEDWFRVLPQLDTVNLNGKQVAVFGLGDQRNYPSAFQDAIGILAKRARARGGELVGTWPTEDYTFTHSEGVENGVFLGLALDYDNQLHLTTQRVKSWVQQLVREFGLA